MDHIIFASFGNDSIALIQWAVTEGRHRAGIDPALTTVAFSDTRWGSQEWLERRRGAQKWAESLGLSCVEIDSKGMEQLVRERKGWPRQGMQFCTEELKIKPALAWLDSVDPARESICMVGIRRAESTRRRGWPEWIEQSDRHGGRTLHSPLVRHSDEQRNELVAAAGFEVLPYRSQECFPCVNANRTDVKQLTEERICEIEALEAEDMGHGTVTIDGVTFGLTGNGKPRTMFRPYRHGGAVGIREVVRWANSKHGNSKSGGYRPLVVLGAGSGCDSGMCGEG